MGVLLVLVRAKTMEEYTQNADTIVLVPVPILDSYESICLNATILI